MDTYICEKCGKSVVDRYGSGRFCSRACANTRVHSELTKQKIRDALANQVEIRFCRICGKQLGYRNSSGLCASCYCRQPKTETAKLKQSKTMRYKDYPRWNIHRDEPSYAEKFFMQVLQASNIDYTFEYAVPNHKNHFYYLDFYIEKDNYKIDLEIDGSQHKDRKEHDQIRDSYLSCQGYIVYRIEWNDLRSSAGKIIMKQKINDFITFYNSL